MSTRNLRSLAKFLTTLGMDTDKVPSVSDFRKAYRSHLHLHPDKAGQDSTPKFQEITEAAKEVFEFLTTTGNLCHEVEITTFYLTRSVLVSTSLLIL